MLELREPVIIAAAARMGRAFLRALRSQGIDVIAFVDNDASKYGSPIDGIPVQAPADLARTHASSPILVASLLAEYELSQQMRGLGFDTVHTLSQLHHAWPEVFVAPYLDGTWESWREAPTIDWADEESQHVYAAILEYRRTRDVSIYAQIRAKHAQYFPTGLVHLTSEDVIADCGAYTGDTFASFRRIHPNARPAYYAFEPDPTNYVTLCDRAEGYTGTFVAIQAGIGEIEGEFRLNATGGMDSTFTESGAISVPVHSIDRFFLRQTPPSFITMDIEGMEPAALRGASSTIRAHSPTLAISVYHRPGHLWEIPQYVRALQPDYRLYIRHYSTNMTDTVMYAIA